MRLLSLGVIVDSCKTPKVSIIILTYDSLALVLRCFEDLKYLNYPNYEIILVDNGSKDRTSEVISSLYPNVFVLKNSVNLGYSAGNNCALRIASGKYLFFLNDDAFLATDSLWHLVEVAESTPDIAVVASKVYKGWSKILESAGAIIEFPLGFGPARGMNQRDIGQYDYVSEVAYASGAAFFVRRDVFEELGGFDPTYFCYHEELDFCWRARLKGYKIVFCPLSVVNHLGSQTSGRVLSEVKYLALSFSNRLLTNVKNLSGRRLITSLFYEIAQTTLILGGAIFFSRARKCCWAILIAFLRVLFNLRATLRMRLAIQLSRIKNDDYVLKYHNKVTLYSHVRNYFLNWR